MKIISYVVLGLFLAVAGLAGVYYVKAQQLEASIARMDGQLKTTQDVLSTTQQSLSAVEASVKVSDKLLSDLGNTLRQSDERGSMIGERVSMLERNNAEIRSFLALRLPDDGCLLDNTCEAGVSVPAPKPRAADQVRPAASGKK